MFGSSPRKGLPKNIYIKLWFRYKIGYIRGLITKDSIRNKFARFIIFIRGFELKMNQSELSRQVFITMNQKRKQQAVNKRINRKLKAETVADDFRVRNQVRYMNYSKKV